MRHIIYQSTSCYPMGVINQTIKFGTKERKHFKFFKYKPYPVNVMIGRMKILHSKVRIRSVFAILLILICSFVVGTVVTGTTLPGSSTSRFGSSKFFNQIKIIQVFKEIMCKPWMRPRRRSSIKMLWRPWSVRSVVIRWKNARQSKFQIRVHVRTQCRPKKAENVQIF